MKVFIIAGEMSGDKHGALLIRELQRLSPGAEVSGLGGELMHAAAPCVENWAEDAAVIGVVEVLKKYGWFRRRFLETLDRIVRESPEVLILVDYPGFNLRMAAYVRKKLPSVKIAYFISPQVWAWHRGRIPKMARILDLMMCIFPFEKPLFENAGLKTEFVGHPLVDDILAMRRSNIRESNLIGLFPGSRPREIERHFPVFLRTAAQLHHRHPEWKFEAAASHAALHRHMQAMARAAALPPQLLAVNMGNYHDLMDRASAALVASGTATLEAALHELPYALVYKVSWGTYLLGRLLVKIPFIGMVNILSGREVIKELIQRQFNEKTASDELERLMQEPRRNQVLAEMREAVAKLGHGGAATLAAQAVLSLCPQQPLMRA
ncbi:MAG: lipid-A-disaccharide synthase [Akkermansiaceae bacterium]|nr:lipid-A-disaccharide synthase [Akkermansiaceae bacterium]